uniref:histidinol dehydrogenase n=1 Tax=Prevotellamassilia timonensis TaxID=1852370 RepID=UPI004038F895
MQIIINPDKSVWDKMCERNAPSDDKVIESVRSIVAEVRHSGDEALRRFAHDFDHADITDIELSAEERKQLAAKVTPQVRQAIDAALVNISAFHKAQMPEPVEVETQPGVRCLQKAVPIQRVGLYIPGGRAPLFSTVLMLAAPARIAGCKHVVLCTPQGADGRIAPEIIYAANACGVDHIYRVGGAQAIAAMAYGTESIARVDKIFGPGNRFVTHAKQLVSTDTAIDMPAGPSEVLVMADHTAKASYVAADMLSQAEHGPDSQAILVCQSEDFAHEVAAEVERQTALLPRKELVEQSLSHSRILVFAHRGTMLDFCNAYAPEHLIISMDNPWDIAADVTAAGSVFVGNYSPESAGDYASGTNHTLPTSGWARSYSGVNIDSFMRKITFQTLTQQGLQSLAGTIVTMAEAEGLHAHAQAVNVRINDRAN